MDTITEKIEWGNRIESGEVVVISPDAASAAYMTPAQLAHVREHTPSLGWGPAVTRRVLTVFGPWREVGSE